MSRHAAVAGEMIATASGSGAYTTTPNINGVELAGGTFGMGMRTAGPGDLAAQLNGVSPLIGLFQHVTLTGWITSSSVNGRTMSFSGTAKLDMGDVTAPLTGLALSGSVTATGVTLTVGSWSFGTLPAADGTIRIELAQPTRHPRHRCRGPYEARGAWFRASLSPKRPISAYNPPLTSPAE